MPDLITRERAIRNLNNLSTTAAENTLLDALVTAVSRAVEGHCRRLFAEERHDELYAGTPFAELLLEHFPLLRIERVASGPAAVLRVTNTSASNQQASVRVTATGLTLTRVASGVTTTSNLDFASNVTLAALAAAVTALGNGWSATVAESTYALRASADLRAPQGALSAKDVSAELQLHVDELSLFEIDAAGGALMRDGVGWEGGPNAWRVIYYAGYSAIPEDVQEACAQWVAVLFWQSKRDPGLAAESIPSVVARTALQDVPASLRVLLAPHRNVCI